MPTTISPLEAASIPCAGDTALVALIYKGKLKSGERVLIRGVGGVVFFCCANCKIYRGLMLLYRVQKQ